MSLRTVYSLLEEAVSKYGEAVALHQPVVVDKARSYQTWTWPQYRDAVREITCGLRAMGVQPGEIVALGSETRAEFYLTDLAIMTNGSTAAALYANSLAGDQVKALRTCGAKIVFLEDPKYLKMLRAAGGGELDVQWILLTGFEEGVATLAEVRARGQAAMKDDRDYFERIRVMVKPEDRAILYLTSGATGEPKMVEVSHAALVANVDMGPPAIPIGPQDRMLAFLPSAHIAQRIALELLPLRMGVPVWFSESLARMPHEFKSVKPTFFLAPPRVWERVYSTVRTELQKLTGIKRTLAFTALGMGQEAAQIRQRGHAVPLRLALPLKLFDKLVFAKIRDRFGGELKFPISGAAPLSKDLGLFYDMIGMPLIEGFGLTEGGINCLNPTDKPRLGTIGKPLQGVKMKISDDGELLIKSPSNATGYFNDPAATAAVFQDGWLYTGDLGSISEDGFVSIVGRKKEMIVSSNGKKIYPSRVEALFKTEPLISQMVLAGEQQPYVAALFTLNPVAAEVLEGMKGKPMEELAKEPVVQKAVKKAVERANKELAVYEAIKKFRILEKDLSIEAGELTPTMKVRTKKVLEKYADRIQEMYGSKEDLL